MFLVKAQMDHKNKNYKLFSSKILRCLRNIASECWDYWETGTECIYRVLGKYAKSVDELVDFDPVWWLVRVKRVYSTAAYHNAWYL